MKTRGFEIVSMYQTTGIHLPERKTGASTGYDFDLVFNRQRFESHV